MLEIYQTQLNGMNGSHQLKFHLSSRLVTITINRPDDRNRITREALEEFRIILSCLKGDQNVSVVVVTGIGRDWFSLGLLTPELKSQMTKDEIVDLVMLANEVYDMIEALPQIVVAVLNGAARAGAVELALACDIRVGAAHTTLCMPEAKWGGFPGAGAPVRLPHLIGYGRGLELIASGREITASEAYDLGLLDRVIASENFASEVGDWLGEIAASGPLALRGAKKIMKVRTEPGYRAAREVSDILRRMLEWTHDADEGIQAHLEDRLPAFRGQ